MMRRGDGGLTVWLIVAYAAPGMVLALPVVPVIVRLPELYGVELGLGLAATGLALGVARLFDALSDPLIGGLADRVRWRHGRRKPWIVVGAFIAGAGLVRILDPPSGADVTYLMVWSVVLYLGWTLVAVPHAAWGAELSGDYGERARITAWREGFGLLGIVMAGIIGVMGAGTTGLAWITVGLGAIVLPVALWRVPDPLPPAPPPVHLPRRGPRSLASNRPFLRLLGAWFLNGLANGVPAALFLLYLDHGLGADERERSVFILGYFAAAIFAVPLWPLLAGRWGKHRVWCGAMLAASAAFALVPLVPYGDFLAFAVITAITGMALGADLVLPPAMQADVVDYDALRRGRARAGLLFALWGLATKLALATSVALALPLVDALGFDPTLREPEGRQALLMIYSALPVVVKILAVAMVWHFPLTPERHAVIARRLSRRHRTL